VGEVGSVVVIDAALADSLANLLSLPSQGAVALVEEAPHCLYLDAPDLVARQNLSVVGRVG